MHVSIYSQIFYLLGDEVGLNQGIFGYYLVELLSTLACCFIVFIPFIVVYWIIRSVMK